MVLSQLNKITQWWDDWHEVQDKDFEWLIEQAKKAQHYEKTLVKIAEDRSVAFWELSSKIAKEALDDQ